MRAIKRRYLREFIPAMAAYVVVVLASTWLLRHHLDGGSLALRIVLALLPVLPLGWAMGAIVRLIRGSDELERQIELEAVSIAALLTGMGFFSAGLLASAKIIALDGDAVAIWVWPVLCLSYGLAKCIAMRRYR
jgi:hypothetical protein